MRMTQQPQQPLVCVMKISIIVEYADYLLEQKITSSIQMKKTFCTEIAELISHHKYNIEFMMIIFTRFSQDCNKSPTFAG